MKQQLFFSGLFYPAEKNELLQYLSKLCQSAKKVTKKNVAAIITPHAGYQYSGKLAAEAFLTVKDKNIKTAIILSPSHQFSFEFAASLSKSSYSTPIGDISINQSLSNELSAHNPYIKPENSYHYKEHGIEVTLPFLEYVSAAQSIVPLVVGTMEKEIIQSIANTIASVCQPTETLIIASTDFSHFFTSLKANEMDKQAVKLIKNFDINQLELEYYQKKIQLCGIAPTLIMLHILKQWGYNNAEHISYTHSGIISGDLERVVGYNSMRFY